MLIAMKPLDPVALTRTLVDIESTTYDEAAVGAYLASLLSERGFVVERTAVPQPANSRSTGERFNVYGDYGARPESCSLHIWIRCLRLSPVAKMISTSTAADRATPKELSWRSWPRRSAAGSRGGGGAAVCGGRGARLRRGAGGEPVSKGSRFLINGEPTDNRLALASKGALRAEIRRMA